MGVYILTDGQGNYIRKDNLTGRYVPVRSFKQAQQWDSQVKAHSILNNSLAKSIRNNYAVQLIDTENIIEKDDMSKQKELCFRAIDDGNIDDWLEKVNTIMNVLSGSDTRKDSKTVSSLKKTDIKRFYNYLADERHLKPATIDNIHTVLHQILDMAVDDDYIRNNPSNNVLKELKQSHCFQTEKRRALTKPEQELFLDYLKNSPTSKYWYPVFAVMIGTGLRVGEVTGLRWCDIDLEEGIIDVNHTLVYYDHRTEGSKRGCYFNVNTTKTPAGRRKVPMLGFVKEAFLMEKERQELLDLHCEATVDGYTDFIFINRFGQPQHQATLNKAIRRIIRDCNDEQLLKDENAEVLLPHFSCHSLRHTFTTRMCEAGVNVKVIQDTLGHKDISTTLNIYTDVTKELRKSEFEGLDSYFKNEYNKVSV